MFDLPLIKSKTSLATIDFLKEVGSTNDRAFELIRSGSFPTPGLILTEKQTSGRGQRSRKWWSGNGSLTFSYVKLANKDLCPLTSLATAVSIVEAIETLTSIQNLKIKWPNDIFCQGRKLSGVLIETTVFQDQRLMIVGIGINANNQSISGQDLESLDAESEHITKPTSIRIETGQDVDLNNLVIGLIDQLENQIADEAMIEKANDRLAFSGEQIRVKSPGQPEFAGTCVCVDSEGNLIIAVEGKPVTLASGTIKAI